MPRLLFPWVAGSIILTVSPVDAQQVVEIDFTGGRTILDEGSRHQPVGIRGDSALVLHFEATEREVDGRTVTADRDYANKVSMHLLRRISGEPCPGVLPSVRTR